MSDIYSIPEVYKNFNAKPSESLYQHTAELVSRLEELSKHINIKYFDLIKLACIYHDIGKSSILFQERLRNNTKFDDKKEVGHNVLSAYLTYYVLLDKNLDNDDLNTVINAVLNHHFYVDNFDVLHNKKDLIEENLDKIIVGEIGKELNIFDKCTKYKKDLGRKFFEVQKKNLNPSEKDILVKGFLHKFDYSASAKTLIEIENKYLEERLSKLNYQWNTMQKFAEENKDKNIILIGSTGLGKTEASLLWIGNNKGIYILPLRTAINAMYRRLKNALYKEDYEDNIGLLHSNIKNIYLNELAEETEESKFWNYYESTRNLALPLTITTPDQIFKFVFKYPSYELALATYSYSKLIIDEIQAYSPELLAFLVYGIQRICKLGGKVAITTATFPPFIKDLLETEYDEDTNKVKIDLGFIEEKFLNDKNRHKLKIINNNISCKDIVEFYIKNNTLDNLKILVVMNTVKSAQDMYKGLKEELEEFIGDELDINLLHARFILKDRNKKEKQIIEDGKTECHKKVIWVSTQVLEASIDIDFDFLFTEFTELGSFFQRMGRCNRKGEKKLDRHNVFLYTKIDLEALVKVGIVDESLHILGKEALNDWEEKSEDSLISEENKYDMINTYYTMDKLKRFENSLELSYLEQYRDTYLDISVLEPNSISIKEVPMHFRNILSLEVIPSSVYRENETNINKIVGEINRIKKEGEKDKLELIKLRDKIAEYIVNVGVYRTASSEERIKVDNQDIIISSGTYSNEIGFNYPKLNGTSSESIFIW
jgi:CRISPR-associated helicase cas3